MARVLKAVISSAVGEYSALGAVRGWGVRDGTPGPEEAAPWPAAPGSAALCPRDAFLGRCQHL